MHNPDPVEKILGTTQWRFWDETWANEHGPFDSEAEARHELGRYCDVVLEGKADPGSFDDVILRESGGEEPSAHLAAQQFRRYGRTGSDILAKRRRG